VSQAARDVAVLRALLRSPLTAEQRLAVAEQLRKEGVLSDTRH